MERGNGIDRSACQGALMRADDGSWWFIHQLVQNGPGNWIGRQQALEPVEWKNGWPMIGEDVDGDGIGESVWSGRVPNPVHPVTAPQTDDDFEGEELGHQWEWNHNPIDEKWSLTERPGWLRLKAPVPVGKGGFWNAPNTVSQRIMGWRKGIATAKLDFSGMKPNQVAGFCHHSGVYYLLGVRADSAGSRRLFLNLNGKMTEGPKLKADIVWMRTEMEAGEAFFEYSLDGKKYRRFGPKFPLKFGRWRGDRIGFFCWNEKKPAGHLDVDWYRYRFHGPSGGME
jgi:beta-xylosidase